MDADAITGWGSDYTYHELCDPQGRGRERTVARR